MKSKPTIPVTLTETDWKKKRSVFSKQGGKTGISESLRTLKSAFGKVKWDAIAITPATATLTTVSLVTLDGVEDTYKSARAGLLPLHNALVEVEKAAKNTHEKYKGNKKIPAASLKFVEDMLELSKQTQVSWSAASADRDWEEWLEPRRKVITKGQTLVKAILENCDLISDFLTVLDTTPTAATFMQHRPQVLPATQAIMADVRKLEEVASDRNGPKVGKTTPRMNKMHDLRPSYSEGYGAAGFKKMVTDVRSDIALIRAWAQPR